MTSCSCWQYRCTEYYLNIIINTINMICAALSACYAALLISWPIRSFPPKMSQFWLVEHWMFCEWVSEWVTGRRPEQVLRTTCQYSLFCCSAESYRARPSHSRPVRSEVVWRVGRGGRHRQPVQGEPGGDGAGVESILQRMLSHHCHWCITLTAQSSYQSSDIRLSLCGKQILTTK